MQIQIDISIYLRTPERSHEINIIEMKGDRKRQESKKRKGKQENFKALRSNYDQRLK